MACGTPVVCSAAGSLGEVVEDAAIIVDPMDVNAIAEGMRSVAGLTDSELTAMRNECLRHAEKFSWKKQPSKPSVSIVRSSAVDIPPCVIIRE